MDFQRITDLKGLPGKLKGGVIAIGNFDGVHRGHQWVLQAALVEAQRRNCPAIVLTFEPHPKTFFAPDRPVFRLTEANSKSAILEQMGFDAVVEYRFDSELASTSAQNFVQQVLLDAFAASHVVTGYDFHFGKGREGTPEFLRSSGESHGFGVSIIEAFTDEGGETISSSRIRDCLEQGLVSEANGLLGYAFRTTGEVIRGKQLGRTLGFPTANLSLAPEARLRHGIYAVRARTPDGNLSDAVASYGRRPTFDNGEALLETCLFDFDKDIYGEMLTVFFFGWLRGEEKFDTVEALKSRMNRDVEEAKALLSGFGPQEGLWPLVHAI